MTTRNEAAAKAQYEAVTGQPWASAPARSAKLCREDAAAIAAALDAHDAAQGIHRLELDDEAVERAARALNKPYALEWEQLPDWVQEDTRNSARAVVAALKEAQG